MELNLLCDESPILMTQELLTQCKTVGAIPCGCPVSHYETIELMGGDKPTPLRLIEKIENYLAISHYRPLPKNASVEETLDWSVGYFDYLRTVLLSKQPLDESINVSFTDWLIAQPSRIARSESDWRECSKQIQRYLDGGYLVIVTVVDALSALNQDILFDELATLENLTVIPDTLFAPLPTLTEIGKLAVLTGKPTHSLPTNSERALQQMYQTSLKIIKSWEDDNLNTPITEQTNLVVFFENRIDERLHDASSFEKHRADILPIARQLKTSIQSWLKDAAHRDVVFFITADHGMTVTNGRYSGEPLGETKDRLFKLKRRETLPDDFVLINQDSKDDYAVPKTRLSLTNSVLAHGGLTPEEVLIPFIKLIRPTFEVNKLPVEAEITSDCLRLGDKFWQLDVRLSASVQVETVRLNLELPFKLELREPIDIIRAQKSHTVTLKFRADIEQEGLIVLAINFKGADDIQAKFKAYLESGEYSIGNDKITSECGLIVLANIELFENQPRRNDYIRHLPVQHLQTLQNAYSQLLEHFQQSLCKTFGFETTLNLSALRENCRKYAELDKFTPDSQGLQAFIKRLQDNKESEAAWLESVATFLGKVPPSKWRKDNEIEAYNRLAEFSERLTDLLTLKAHQIDVNSETNVTVIRLINAKEGERNLMIPACFDVAIEKKANLFFNELSEEFHHSDNNVKLALVTHIEQGTPSHF